MDCEWYVRFAFDRSTSGWLRFHFDRFSCFSPGCPSSIDKKKKKMASRTSEQRDRFYEDPRNLAAHYTKLHDPDFKEHRVTCESNLPYNVSHKLTLFSRRIGIQHQRLKNNNATRCLEWVTHFRTCAIHKEGEATETFLF